GPGLGDRVEDLVLAVEHLAGAIEPGHGQYLAVGQAGQGRVPPLVVHVADPHVLLSGRVELVGLLAALEVLLVQGHRPAERGDGALLRWRQAGDRVLRRLGVHRRRAGFHSLDEDGLRPRGDGGGALPPDDLGGGGRWVEGELAGGAVAAAVRGDELHTLREHHG